MEETEMEKNNRRHLSPATKLSNGRYQIERLVSAGSWGAVYRTLDLRFNRLCALKEMLDDFQNDADRSLAVEWFTREATLLLDLNHPCLPRVRDFFEENGRHYLIMDFIEGRTLDEVLKQEGNVAGLNGARGVSEARARSWAQQICSVLGYLHRQTPSILFRDLKPSNIMVTDKDDVKLINFGIARTFQQTPSSSMIIMTIGYAPPEQLHGRPEPRSDLYALGATIHLLLTHRDAADNKPTIFDFPSVRALRPDVSVAFEQVIARALEAKLEKLWPSAADMERALINLPPLSASDPSAQAPDPSTQPALQPMSAPTDFIHLPPPPQPLKQPINSPDNGQYRPDSTLELYKNYVKTLIYYSVKKAARQRLIHQILQITILLGAALVSIIIAIRGVPSLIPAIISGIVTLSTVLSNYYKFGDRSRDLYLSAESIQQEYNLFKEKRGYYKGLSEKEALEILQDKIDLAKHEQFIRSLSFDKGDEGKK